MEVDGVSYNVWISIHALLAESDNSQQEKNNGHENFYPRSPCGERRISLTLIIGFSEFLSTLSLRRATAQSFSALHNIFISIHALLAESDTVHQ